MQPIRCDAVLFDLDGTLVDSGQCVDIAWTKWAEEYGMDPTEIIYKAQGQRTIDSLRFIAPHLDPEKESAKLETLELSVADGLVPIAGATELLKTLPARRWAIVTSCGRKLAKHRLGHFGIEPPSVMITAGDVAAGKPDPEGYLKAAWALGVERQNCIVVEDAPAGIKAARAAGMKVIAIVSTNPADDLREADVIISDLTFLELAQSEPELELVVLNDSIKSLRATLGGSESTAGQ